MMVMMEEEEEKLFKDWLLIKPPSPSATIVIASILYRLFVVHTLKVVKERTQLDWMALYCFFIHQRYLALKLVNELLFSLFHCVYVHSREDPMDNKFSHIMANGNSKVQNTPQCEIEKFFFFFFSFRDRMFLQYFFSFFVGRLQMSNVGLSRLEKWEFIRLAKKEFSRIKNVQKILRGLWGIEINIFLV